MYHASLSLQLVRYWIVWYWIFNTSWILNTYSVFLKKSTRQIIICHFQQWTARIKTKSDLVSEKLVLKDIKNKLFKKVWTIKIRGWIKGLAEYVCQFSKFRYPKVCNFTETVAMRLYKGSKWSKRSIFFQLRLQTSLNPAENFLKNSKNRLFIFNFFSIFVGTPIRRKYVLIIQLQ